MSKIKNLYKKIYCANCKNCQLVIAGTIDGVLKRKVRCAAGHWRKKLGGEKLLAIEAVPNLVPPGKPCICPDYDEKDAPIMYIKEPIIRV